MIFEAIKISSERPSVAADALINPLRAAMRALSRIINNQSRSSEYSVRLCLSHLLGMRQFECSHAFKFVYAHALHLYLLEQNEWNSEAEQNAVDQSDPIENILHEDWTIDANAEYSHGSLEVKDGRIFMISQAIDYRYRPLEFKDHSPLEYFITTIKVKKSESESKINIKAANKKVQNYMMRMYQHMMILLQMMLILFFLFLIHLLLLLLLLLLVLVVVQRLMDSISN